MRYAVLLWIIVAASVSMLSCSKKEAPDSNKTTREMNNSRLLRERDFTTEQSTYLRNIQSIYERAVPVATSMDSLFEWTGDDAKWVVFREKYFEEAKLTAVKSDSLLREWKSLKHPDGFAKTDSLTGVVLKDMAETAHELKKVLKEKERILVGIKLLSVGIMMKTLVRDIELAQRVMNIEKEQIPFKGR